MTDRYNAFVVVLENDLRDDDADEIVKAITLLRGVLAVTPHIADMATTIAEVRVKNDVRQKLFDVLR